MCLLSATGVGIGCSLTTDLDGFTGESRDGGTTSSDGGDAGGAGVVRPDDAGSRDGSDGDTGSNTSILPNGDFETAGGGCGPHWYEDFGYSRIDDRPHGGSFACRVCRKDESIPYFGIDSPEDLAPDARAGDTFRARAWIRRSGPGVSAVELHLRLYAPNDESALQNVSASAEATDEWTLLETTLTLEHDVGGGRLNVYLSSLGAPLDACFDIDDVEVSR